MNKIIVAMILSAGLMTSVGVRLGDAATWRLRSYAAGPSDIANAAHGEGRRGGEEAAQGGR